MRDKYVKVKREVHTALKLLAVEEDRPINNDLVNDVILYGIEEYRRVKKNLATA